MVIVGFLSWWYGIGWWQRVRAVGQRLASTFDYFSIDLLIKTLFSPFRQISAGKVRGPIGVQMRAFFDRLISRIIGSIVRSFMIIIGSCWLFITAVFGVLTVVIWAIVPFLPVLGFLLTISGWLPWN